MVWFSSPRSGGDCNTVLQKMAGNSRKNAGTIDTILFCTFDEEDTKLYEEGLDRLQQAEEDNQRERGVQQRQNGDSQHGQHMDNVVVEIANDDKDATQARRAGWPVDLQKFCGWKVAEVGFI